MQLPMYGRSIIFVIFHAIRTAPITRLLCSLAVTNDTDLLLG